jgi:hypothetical protein
MDVIHDLPAEKVRRLGGLPLLVSCRELSIAQLRGRAGATAGTGALLLRSNGPADDFPLHLQPTGVGLQFTGHNHLAESIPLVSYNSMANPDPCNGGDWRYLEGAEMPSSNVTAAVRPRQ